MAIKTKIEIETYDEEGEGFDKPLVIRSAENPDLLELDVFDEIFFVHLDDLTEAVARLQNGR